VGIDPDKDFKTWCYRGQQGILLCVIPVKCIGPQKSGPTFWEKKIVKIRPQYYQITDTIKALFSNGIKTVQTAVARQADNLDQKRSAPARWNAGNPAHLRPQDIAELSWLTWLIPLCCRLAPFY
jgi:hypothetical protein